MADNTEAGLPPHPVKDRPQSRVVQRLLRARVATGIRSPHFWAISLLMALFVFVYYGVLSSFHDVYVVLFFYPLMYAAIAYRLRGVLVSGVVFLLILLPYVFLFTPEPYSVARTFLFAAFAFLVTSLGATLLNYLEHQVDAYEEILALNEELENYINIIKESERQLATLNRIASTVSSSLELSEVLAGAIDSVINVTGADNALVFLLDKEAGELVLAAHRGASAEFVKGVDRLRLGEGFNGRVAASGEPLYIEDVSKDSRLTREIVSRDGVRSALIVPLSSKSRVNGTLCVNQLRARQFKPEEIEMLVAIGNQIGVAVENANLYQEQQQVARELENSLEQLRTAQRQLIHAEKMNALGQLSAAIAHEINNPLAGVLVYSQLMAKKMREGSLETAEALEEIAKIETAVTHCSRLVRGLLDFSRQTEPKLQAVFVDRVIDEVLSLVGHQAKMNKVEVVREPAGSPVPVMADFGQLQQVLLNLVVNAIQSMPNGGQLTLRTTGNEDGWVRMSVQDTGYGIAPENMEKLFTPFFSTKDEIKGVGLGLSVSLGIVERHGGRIDVESEVGRGSTFTVILPAHNGETPPVP